MVDLNEHISFFVTRFYLSVRFRRLFQRAALIDDRLDLLRLDQLFQEEQFYLLLARRFNLQFPFARNRRPKGEKAMREPGKG